MKKTTDSQTAGEIPFFTLNPRRKARNRLQKPRLQLAFAMYAILLTILFSVSIIATVYLAFGDLYHAILDTSELRLYYKNEIRENFQASIGTLIPIVLTYVILIMVISVVFTERMVGPTIAFLRHINALKNGVYSARITLRKRDELQELAAELNELAEILERKSERDRNEELKALQSS